MAIPSVRIVISAVTAGVGPAVSGVVDQLGGLGGIAAGVGAAFGAMAVKAVQASNEAASASRVLSASATEAGIAFNQAAAGAEKLAALTGQAGSEADRTYAKFLSLTKGEGIEATDKFARAFADLAAARGIAASQLGDIAQQLYTLQDEATDKLLGANPSAFYDKYAAAIGKATSALTDQEKRRAVLNAVEEQSQIFSGEAEKRALSTAGQIEKLTNGIGDLFVKIGDTITGTKELNDVLQVLNAVVGGFLGGKADFTNKTAYEVAAERAGSAWAQFMNIVTTGATLIGVVVAAPFTAIYRAIQGIGAAFDAITSGNLNAFRQIKSDIDSDIETAKQAIFGIGDRRLEYEKGIAQQQKADADKQAADAAKQAEKLEKEKGEAVAKAQKAEADKYQKRAITMLKKANDDIAAMFDEVAASYAGKDNPYVKLFAEGEAMADKLQKKFGILGKEAVATFTEINRKALETQLQALRFESQLGALDINQRRRRLDDPTLGLSSREEARVGGTAAALRALFEGGTLRREVENLRSGKTATPEENQKFIAEQFNRLRGVSLSGVGRGRDAQQALLDQGTLDLAEQAGGIAALLKSADPALKALGDAALAAKTNQANRLDQERNDAFAKAKLADRDVQEIDEKLQLIEDIQSGRKVGPTPISDAERKVLENTKEADARIISLLGNIPEKDKTARQVEAEKAALEREEKRKAQEEKTARDAVDKTNSLLESIKKQNEEMLKNVREGKATAILRIKNFTEAEVDDDDLPAQPTAKTGTE